MNKTPSSMDDFQLRQAPGVTVEDMSGCKRLFAS